MAHAYALRYANVTDAVPVTSPYAYEAEAGREGEEPWDLAAVGKGKDNDKGIKGKDKSNNNNHCSGCFARAGDEWVKDCPQQ